LGRLLRNGGLLYFVILMVFAVILVRYLSAGSTETTTLNNVEFQNAVDEQSFVLDPAEEERKLTVLDEDQKVTGLLKSDSGKPDEFEYFYTQQTDVAATLNEADIAFDVDPQNTGFWLSLLATLGPIFLIIILFLFIMSSMQGGGNRVMSFGKSRAKRMTKDQPKVTFNDVAGAQEAVQELSEIKEFLESPQKFQKLGA